MNNKFLSIIFESEKWEIPIEVIARNRAKYYAELDCPGRHPGSWDYKKVYNSEYDMAMHDERLLLNWASGNMNWSDIEPFAKMIPMKAEIDREAKWSNAPKTIVEK